MRPPFFQSALYAIIDKETFQRQGVDVVEGARALLRGGCKVIQYRDKISHPTEIARTAFALLRSARAHNAMLVINDAVSTFVQLYGPSMRPFAKHLAFHFGQSDLRPARVNLPAFGRSTHNIEEIRLALRETPRPNYIAFGSLFPSTTKPQLTTVLEEIPLAAALWPGHLVFIGGINLANLREINRKLTYQRRFSFAILSDLFRFGNRPEELERYAIEFAREVRFL